MSVAKLASSTQQWDDLVKMLRREMTAPQAGLVEPIIIEEKPPEALGRIRLYVIWAKWKDIPQVERARIIRDAYKETQLFNVDNVFSAVGLTADEAERLGIRYADAAPV
jgi:hypothetical protein